MAINNGKRKDDLIKYVTEFVGTFVLNLSITMHSDQALHSQFQPLAVMFTIIAIVDIGAPISGAHYNPGLTLAFFTAGDRTSPSPILYVLVQIVAAIAASSLAYGLDGYSLGSPVPKIDDGKHWAQYCASDFLGSYIALTMVLYTAMLTKKPLGHWGPFLVGTTFYVCIELFESVSGAIFNPGLAVGLWVVGMAANSQTSKALSICMLLLFDLLGGLAAGLTARAILSIQQADDKAADKSKPPTAKGGESVSAEP